MQQGSTAQLVFSSAGVSLLWVVSYFFASSLPPPQDRCTGAFSAAALLPPLQELSTLAARAVDAAYGRSSSGATNGATTTTSSADGQLGSGDGSSAAVDGAQPVAAVGSKRATLLALSLSDLEGLFGSVGAGGGGGGRADKARFSHSLTVHHHRMAAAAMSCYKSTSMQQAAPVPLAHCHRRPLPLLLGCCHHHHIIAPFSPSPRRCSFRSGPRAPLTTSTSSGWWTRS